jgi:mono/diheme cytochrome c family protein
MRRDGRTTLAWVVLAFAAAAANAQDPATTSLFVQNCSACHQADGSGTPGLAPPLKGAHWQKLVAERSYLPRVIAFGLTGPIKVGDAVFNSGMPAQGQLSDEQLARLANHVASELNAANLSPDWKPYDVAEVASVRATQHTSTEQRQLRSKILAP